jgi:hypothetical protein
MKKIICSAICAIGILGAGCDMDIPTEQIGSFSLADFCALTGGVFNFDNNHCTCGGIECGNNVTCVVDTTSSQYVCMGQENGDYPQYTCIHQGMTLCFDRIVNKKPVGYYVTCDGTSWGNPVKCENNNSCRGYLEHDVFYASQCGNCNNSDENCIRGTKPENQ